MEDQIPFCNCCVSYTKQVIDINVFGDKEHCFYLHSYEYVEESHCHGNKVCFIHNILCSVI